MENQALQFKKKELVWNDELQAHPLTWTFEELKRQRDNKTTNFDIAYQRGHVWTNKDNSDYIQSVLCGMTTGTFLLNRIGDVYEGIDGKQREFAVCEYIENNYKLNKNTEPVIFEGKKYTIGGCHFRDLPVELQIRIKSRTIDIYWFDNLSTDNIIKVFKRVNSGKPVTKADIARIKVKSRAIFVELTKHFAINNGVRATDIKKGVHEDIVKWIWCLCNNEVPNLLSSYTEKILENTEVTEEQKQQLETILDYVEVLVKEGNKKSNKKIFNKIKTRTHFVMVGYAASVAIEKGVSKKDFAQRILEFFNVEGKTPTISADYNDAMKGGTAKPEQVRIRMREIEKVI